MTDELTKKINNIDDTVRIIVNEKLGQEFDDLKLHVQDIHKKMSRWEEIAMIILSLLVILPICICIVLLIYRSLK